MTITIQKLNITIMKKKIKITSMLVSLLICGATFVACGGNDKENEVYVPKDGDGFYYPIIESRPFTSNYYEFINGGKEVKLDLLGEDYHSSSLPSFVEYKGEKYPLTCIGEKACTFGYISYIPENVTIIEKKAFEFSKMQSISLPSTLKTIGAQAFLGCENLIQIVIPDGVSNIEEAAFGGCRELTMLDFGSGLRELKREVFAGCSIKVLTIPGSIEVIGPSAFERCRKLESLTIMNGVRIISESAFSQCIKLSSIEIPATVTSIGESAFRSDFMYVSHELYWVSSKIKEPFEISSYVFNEDFKKNGTLYVPKGTVEKYRATKGWMEINTIKEQ